MNEGLKPLAERYFSGRMKDILLADSDSPDETYEYRLFSGKEVAVVKKAEYISFPRQASACRTGAELIFRRPSSGIY